VPISIGVPAVVAGSELALADGGSGVFTDPDGATDVVVQPLESGVRIETVINGPNSPTAYEYALGEGIIPILNGDGSVDLVVSSGGISFGVAHVDKPWAIDGAGARVPTHFSVNGSKLVQVVTHTGRGVQYPVVADPAFQADCGIVTCTVRFDRARTYWLASHPSERDLVLALGCLTLAGIGGEIGGLVCGAIAAVIYYHANKAADYYAQGKCYGYRYPISNPPLGWSTAVTRYTYNCR